MALGFSEQLTCSPWSLHSQGLGPRPLEHLVSTVGTDPLLPPPAALPDHRLESPTSRGAVYLSLGTVHTDMLLELTGFLVPWTEWPGSTLARGKIPAGSHVLRT